MNERTYSLLTLVDDGEKSYFGGPDKSTIDGSETFFNFEIPPVCSCKVSIDSHLKGGTMPFKRLSSAFTHLKNIENKTYSKKEKVKKSAKP